MQSKNLSEGSHSAEPAVSALPSPPQIRDYSIGCARSALMAAASFRGLASLLAVLVLFLAVSHGREEAAAASPYVGKEAGGVTSTVAPEGLERSSCSIEYIDVTQAETQPLPNGIPAYTVEVVNTCLPGTGCGASDGSILDVHLHCGWFSSARQLNPLVFRRLGHDDCLVNDGCPIPAGGVVSFQYAQTYPYQLSVSSVSCTCN